MISLSHLASFSELLTPSVISGSRFNGNNILDSSPCGLRVDWSYVRVFSWFALQMNHENQTTKSHEPGITKRHKSSADESSMLLPFQRFFPAHYQRKPLKRLYESEVTLITGLKPRCE